jgi:hypothetical protein
LATTGGQERRPRGSESEKLAVAVAIAGLLGMAALVRAYWKLLTSASPEVGAAIVSASALILVALAGAILNSFFARRQQIEQELRQRKAEVYTEFLEYWFWVMRYRSRVSEETPLLRGWVNNA